LSSASVPGSAKNDVVYRSVEKRAEIPAPPSKLQSARDEWTRTVREAILSSRTQQKAAQAHGEWLSCVFRTLRNYFQLEEAERRLAARLRERRRGNAWKATRQIELERQRLGRELHTGVGQMLSAVRLQLELVSANIPEPSPVVRQALERISILVRDALEEVRSVSRRLHPPDWQRLTLESALRLLWGMSGISENYQAAFQIDPLPFEPDLDRKILVYRCLQEALSNVVHHSRAKRVEVSLRVVEGRLVLTVEDDGVGFDVSRVFSAVPSTTMGIGLHAVREHAAAVGGKLDIQSGPVGTKLELSVPLPTQQ
jgi:signal transduction histidine kinase